MGIISKKVAGELRENFEIFIGDTFDVNFDGNFGKSFGGNLVLSH